MANVSTEKYGVLSLREQQRLLTRNRLVDAARSVFEENGYGRATVGDITKTANVNRATFYLHFRDKAEVFNEVYARLREARSAHFWSLLGHALAVGTDTAVRDWLDEAVVWWDENAALLPAVHEAMATDLQVAERWKMQIDELGGQLSEYLETFAPEERDERRERVELLMVMLDQVCFRALVQGVMDVSRPALLDLVTGVWVDALGLRRTA